MANIIRTDPLQDLTRFDPFRDLENFAPWLRLRRWMREVPGEPLMKLDVTEDEKAFYVKAELPGVKKEDIVVEVDGDQVSITAEVKRETEEKKGETVVHSERYYGRQYRSFTLGRAIERSKADARFDNGVLSLTLPKNGARTGQALKIA